MTTIPTLALFSLGALTLSACSKASEPPTSKPPQADANTANTQPQPPGPTTSVTARKPLVEANNKLSFDIYQRLGNTGNRVFSPASVSAAMAMAYAGASHKTRAEIANTFGFPVDMPDFHAAYRDVLADLQNQPSTGVLQVANAFWAAKNYKFLPAYVDLIETFYGAKVSLLDFASAPNDQRLLINRWVAAKTKDRIKNLLPAGSVTTITKSVLTNAIYFKAQWAQQFSTTAKQPFWTSAQDRTTVDIMSNTGSYRYADTDGLQVLELPYRGGAMSMVIILPRSKTGLASVEAQLNATELARILKTTTTKRVALDLPKFKIEQSISLTDMLSALGMPTPFSDAADFSAMTGTRELKISDVVHKAFIEVDEHGTEAAAATGIAMEAKSIAPPKDEVVFRADHPFLFALRDMRSDQIVFYGRVINPNK